MAVWPSSPPSVAPEVRVGVSLEQGKIHDVGGIHDLLRNELGVVISVCRVAYSLDPLRGLQPVIVAVAGVLRLDGLGLITLYKADILVLAPNLVEHSGINKAADIVDNDIGRRYMGMDNELPHHGQSHLWRKIEQIAGAVRGGAVVEVDLDCNNLARLVTGILQPA